MLCSPVMIYGYRFRTKRSLNSFLRARKLNKHRQLIKTHKRTTYKLYLQRDDFTLSNGQ